MLEHGGNGSAVLSLEAVVYVETLLDLLQAFRIAVENRFVAPQLGPEILGLDSQLPQPRGERVQLGVRSRNGLGQPLGVGQH